MQWVDAQTITLPCCIWVVLSVDHDVSTDYWWVVGSDHRSPLPKEAIGNIFDAAA